MGGKRHFGPFGEPAAIARLLGTSKDELNTELSAGKSLAEVAEAKAISEEDLIAKIKEQATEQIKSFVESRGGIQHGFGGLEDTASS